MEKFLSFVVAARAATIHLTVPSDRTVAPERRKTNSSKNRAYAPTPTVIAFVGSGVVAGMLCMRSLDEIQFRSLRYGSGASCGDSNNIETSQLFRLKKASSLWTKPRTVSVPRERIR
jgi:hypothetical protein